MILTPLYCDGFFIAELFGYQCMTQLTRLEAVEKIKPFGIFQRRYCLQYLTLKIENIVFNK
jgi:hypothetical protein